MRRFLRLAGLLVTLSLGLSALEARSDDVPLPPQKQQKATAWNATGKQGAVAGGGLEACEAGLTLLRAGGNAMDAAAATLFALSVTDGTLFCFGGEVPIMVYDAKRKTVEVYCGLGAAPKLATQAYFAAKKGNIPAKGVEPAAVPGMVDAVLTMLDRQGTKTFAETAAPALRLLDRKEKAWHGNLAKTIRRMIDAEKAAGDDRKRGLRFVADYFYRGPLAQELDAWCRANGGLIRYTDLATHTTRIEEPVSIDYHGYTVYKCGFWTQGPYLLQTLRLLEPFDLKAMGHNKADTIHVMAEAMKLALADRDFFYADPLFASVPAKQLLSREYADLRRSLIDPKKASREHRPGDPQNGKPLLPNPMLRVGPGSDDKDTTTCLVADSMGNVVAATPSGFNGVVAGSTGVYLGTRLQSFNVWEGHPNCIEPGKRPRITLTPGMVFKDGKPYLAVSVAGGDAQDQCALQLLVNTLEFGMPPAEAVSDPRFGTDHLVGSFRQKAPKLGSLQLNPGISESVAKELDSRGHVVTRKTASVGAATLLRIDPTSGVIHAAGDPRAKRHAVAY